MKKIVFGLVVLALLVVGGFFFLTQPLVTTAKGFFRAVNENNMTKVVSYLSQGFKANTTNAQLANYLVSYKIINHKSVNFGLDRKIELQGKERGKLATLKGRITSSDGTTSPIKLTFQKERDGWKIFAIEKKLTKKEQEEKAKEAKIRAEYTQLSRISMHYLAQASHDNNMTILYNQISKRWQKSATVEDLNKSYGVFHEKKINLLALDKVVPTLTTINIDKNNILTLAGYYIAGKNRIFFKQKYVVEDKVWKLVAMGVEIK